MLTLYVFSTCRHYLLRHHFGLPGSTSIGIKRYAEHLPISVFTFPNFATSVFTSTSEVTGCRLKIYNCLFCLSTREPPATMPVVKATENGHVRYTSHGHTGNLQAVQILLLYCMHRSSKTYSYCTFQSPYTVTIE